MGRLRHIGCLLAHYPVKATLEGRGLQIPELTGGHRGERAVLDPTPSPFPYACMVACNQVAIRFLQIAGGKGVETTMAIPHVLAAECQKESYAVPEQADVLTELAEQGFNVQALFRSP